MLDLFLIKKHEYFNLWYAPCVNHHDYWFTMSVDRHKQHETVNNIMNLLYCKCSIKVTHFCLSEALNTVESQQRLQRYYVRNSNIQGKNEVIFVLYPNLFQ